MGLSTAMKWFVPARQGQSQGEDVSQAALQRTIPLAGPPAAAPAAPAAPQGVSAALSIFQGAAPGASLSIAAAPAAPQVVAAMPTPAPGVAPATALPVKKLEGDLMDIFKEDKVEMTPFQNMAAQLPEVDISGLYKECMETKERLARRCY